MVFYEEGYNVLHNTAINVHSTVHSHNTHSNHDRKNEHTLKTSKIIIANSQLLL